MDLFEYDRREGVALLCGVDEAGRGPLAGDVYAAAVILPPDARIDGLDDSKKLTAKKRDALYDIICDTATAFCVATASVAEIEEVNILNATFLAMRRAVDGLPVRPGLVLVDGNRNPRLEQHSRCVVKGDAASACIAAASILAKVERDRYMEELHRAYPAYQFDKHKGYGTALHYKMLDEFGPCPAHRPSFLKKYEAAKQTGTSPKNAGRRGEDAAAAWLAGKGYLLLERNWRCEYGEIDLIARQGETLAFIEVKTRTEGQLTEPRDAVTAAKRRRLLKTGVSYLQETNSRLQPRFDVVEVFLAPSKPARVLRINQLENAFGGEELDAAN